MRSMTHEDFAGRNAFRQTRFHTLDHAGIGVNRHDPRGPSMQQFLRDDTGAAATVSHDSAYHALSEVIQEGLIDLMGYVDVDRKSTRLNSSHSQISYAVF